MTVLHEEKRVAESAVAAAFSDVALVEELMSLYRADSQLVQLNRYGVVHRPHPYLVEVLNYAQTLSQRSKGAFDVTVQPLWELYQQAMQRGELPRETEVAAARQRVSWRKLFVSPDKITLRSGAAITLNGVAQGYAADRALAALRQHGVKHALVDAGELGALGGKPSNGAWTVGVQHPRDANAYVALTNLSNGCLATSGDYETTFSPDFLHHHLFDPRTGRSPQELASVTVAARSAMEADGLSTAVFVLGPTRGAELVRRTPGAAALLVLKQGDVLATDDFPHAKS
jgi:thiamine biosynthesis lipoprotein